MAAAGQADHLEKHAAKNFKRAKAAPRVFLNHLREQCLGIGKVFPLQQEVRVLLVQERRQLRHPRHRDILQVERIDVEVGTQEALGKIDDDKTRTGRQWHQVDAVRQHEGQRAAPDRTHRAADRLLCFALERHHDLEKFMAMRPREGRSNALVANIEFEIIRTLTHCVGVHRVVCVGRSVRVRHG